MKPFIMSLFIGLLTAFSAHAQLLLPQEVDLCEYGDCTQQMHQIQGEFSATTEFDPLATPIGLYSGSCYHLMGGIDPKHEHHGGFVFWRDEENKDAMLFRGVFSFFAKNDPFDGMTPQEGWDYLAKRSSVPKIVREETTLGRVHIPSESADIEYWMRTTADGKEMFLLSKWEFRSGHLNRSFCHLKRH